MNLDGQMLFTKVEVCLKYSYTNEFLYNAGLFLLSGFIFTVKTKFCQYAESKNRH